MNQLNTNTHTVWISIPCDVYPSLRTFFIVDVLSGLFEMIAQFLKIAILRYDSHNLQFADLRYTVQWV